LVGANLTTNTAKGKVFGQKKYPCLEQFARSKQGCKDGFRKNMEGRLNNLLLAAFHRTRL
jgi:hypothetical protein